MSTRSYYEFALRPCRMRDRAGPTGRMRVAFATFAAANLTICQSDQSQQQAPQATPQQSPVASHIQLPFLTSPLHMLPPASRPFWHCLALVVLVLLLCFWLTLARLAAFWLAFFKTSGDTLAHTHTHRTTARRVKKKDIVNSVGVFFAFAEHNNCNH